MFLSFCFPLDPAVWGSHTTCAAQAGKAINTGKNAIAAIAHQCLSYWEKANGPMNVCLHKAFWLVGGTSWCCTQNQLADQIKGGAQNEESYDTVLATHTPHGDKWIRSNGRTSEKRNVQDTLTHFYYEGLSVVTKFTSANTGCNQNSETLFIWLHLAWVSLVSSLTQYITGLSLFHTLINRNLFHCIQQIYILSYSYICKLPIFHTNLMLFILASLILQRS